MKKLLYIILFSLTGIALQAQSTSAVMKVQVTIISGAKITMVAQADKALGGDSIIISSAPNTEVMVGATNKEFSGIKSSTLLQNNFLESDLAKGIHTISISSLINEANITGSSSQNPVRTTIDYL